MPDKVMWMWEIMIVPSVITREKLICHKTIRFFLQSVKRLLSIMIVGKNMLLNEKKGGCAEIVGSSI